MAAERIAAVFLAATSTLLGAQQSVCSHFSIQISDLNGAPVSAAEIEAIERPGQIIGVTKTDANGNATLDLPPGHRVYLLIPKDSPADEELSYEAYVKHFNVPIRRFVCSDGPGPGWHQACALKFDGLLVQDQPLKIIAVVGELPCTACVGVEPLHSVPSAESPELVFLPLQPLGNLAPLPSYRARRRW